MNAQPISSPACHDPYDLWSSERAISIRERFYRGETLGELQAAAVATIDWLLPGLARRILRTPRRLYPITVAQWILSRSADTSAASQLDSLVDCAAYDQPDGIGWGLGFPWMSKNGLYPADTPFVTHTPYVMEALLLLAEDSSVEQRAIEVFERTLPFLNSLIPMHEDDETLALSYSPIPEPRIVVNANAYASFAYALHADRCGDIQLEQRAIKLARWVTRQQQGDGSFFYYADRHAGNFIDTFHTCFVLKNLRKASALLATIDDLSRDAIARGAQFIETTLRDERTGLVRRFATRDGRDPWRWDLYDQAEYLGLLIDSGQLDRANSFATVVTTQFYRGGHWYSRKDFMGRLWGKDFYRWGSMPFLHNLHRLSRLSGI